MQIEQIKNIEELKILFEKTLQNQEKTLRTALSGKPLVYLAGVDFTKHYMNERIKSGIFLKSLRYFHMVL